MLFIRGSNYEMLFQSPTMPSLWANIVAMAKLPAGRRGTRINSIVNILNRITAFFHYLSKLYVTTIMNDLDLRQKIYRVVDSAWKCVNICIERVMHVAFHEIVTFTFVLQRKQSPYYTERTCFAEVRHRWCSCMLRTKHCCLFADTHVRLHFAAHTILYASSSLHAGITMSTSVDGYHYSV